jgi:hypothetical protein
MAKVTMVPAGPNVIKTFFFVADAATKKAGEFFLDKFYLVGLTFASMAGGYLSGAIGITRERYTDLDKTCQGKMMLLFCRSISGEEKKFCNIHTRSKLVGIWLHQALSV